MTGRPDRWQEKVSICLAMLCRFVRRQYLSCSPAMRPSQRRRFFCKVYGFLRKAFRCNASACLQSAPVHRGNGSQRLATSLHVARCLDPNRAATRAILCELAGARPSRKSRSTFQAMCHRRTRFKAWSLLTSVAPGYAGHFFTVGKCPGLASAPWLSHERSQVHWGTRGT